MGSKNKENFAMHIQAFHYKHKVVEEENILHAQEGDGNAQVVRGGRWTTEVILYTQEGEEAHKEMEEEKPAVAARYKNGKQRIYHKGKEKLYCICSDRFARRPVYSPD